MYSFKNTIMTVQGNWEGIYVNSNRLMKVQVEISKVSIREVD